MMKPRRPEIFYWVRDLGICVIAVLLITNFIGGPLRVNGTSMMDSFYDGELVLIEKLSPRFGWISRGDVVICHFPGMDDDFVKRVIGMPGDSVEIRDGMVYIDGESYPEKYVSHELRQERPPFRLQNGEYWLLGDNRADSMDGRALGALRGRDISAKVVRTIWPLNRAR